MACMAVVGGGVAPWEEPGVIVAVLSWMSKNEAGIYLPLLLQKSDVNMRTGRGGGREERRSPVWRSEIRGAKNHEPRNTSHLKAPATEGQHDGRLPYGMLTDGSRPTELDQSSQGILPAILENRIQQIKSIPPAMCNKTSPYAPLAHPDSITWNCITGLQL
jgi:hypothetical protein